MKCTFETKYTTIRSESPDDVYEYAFNIGRLWYIGKKHDPRHNPELLHKRTDEIVEEVARQQGNVDLTRFHIYIALHKSRNEMQYTLSKMDTLLSASRVEAFYHFPTKTIHVALDTVDRNIMLHEITHAVEHYKGGSPIHDETEAKKSIWRK